MRELRQGQSLGRNPTEGDSKGITRANRYRRSRI